jgi:hypothetical protein
MKRRLMKCLFAVSVTMLVTSFARADHHSYRPPWSDAEENHVWQIFYAQGHCSAQGSGVAISTGVSVSTGVYISTGVWTSTGTAQSSCQNIAYTPAQCAQGYPSASGCLQTAQAYEQTLQQGYERASADEACQAAFQLYVRSEGMDRAKRDVRSVACAFSTVMQPELYCQSGRFTGDSRRCGF